MLSQNQLVTELYYRDKFNRPNRTIKRSEITESLGSRVSMTLPKATGPTGTIGSAWFQKVPGGKRKFEGRFQTIIGITILIGFVCVPAYMNAVMFPDVKIGKNALQPVVSKVMQTDPEFAKVYHELVIIHKELREKLKEIESKESSNGKQ